MLFTDNLNLYLLLQQGTEEKQETDVALSAKIYQHNNILYRAPQLWLSLLIHLWDSIVSSRLLFKIPYMK